MEVDDCSPPLRLQRRDAGNVERCALTAGLLPPSPPASCVLLGWPWCLATLRIKPLVCDVQRPLLQHSMPLVQPDVAGRCRGILYLKTWEANRSQTPGKGCLKISLSLEKGPSATHTPPELPCSLLITSRALGLPGPVMSCGFLVAAAAHFPFQSSSPRGQRPSQKVLCV